MAISKTAPKQHEKRHREGKTYETGIGLNLDLNRISTVTSSTLKEIESIFPEYTTRPLAKQFKYEESKVYNILIFDTKTTTTGKSAELCQLSVTDQSGMHQFSTHILPEQAIDCFASRVNKLKIFKINGQGRIFQDNKEMSTVPLEETASNLFHSLWTEPSPKLTKTSKRSYLVTNHQPLTLLYF